MARIIGTKSIRTKILGVIFFSAFLITFTLGYLSFEFSKRRLVYMLGETIKGVAATTANVINAEDLFLIFDNAEKTREVMAVANTPNFYRMNKEGISSPSSEDAMVINQIMPLYKKYTDLLSNIKTANKIDSPINIYIEDKHSLWLVLTSDRGIMTGARYRMIPEAENALSTNTAQSTGIYKDKDGTWISAYAPIPPAAGQNRRPIIEMTYQIDSYLKKLHSELEFILLVCLIGFLGTILLSYKLVSSLISAIEKLDKMAKELENEKYDILIDIKSEDEIGHLARTFEKLRLSVREKIDELKAALVREKKSHLQSIVAITNAIELRDPYTGKHIYRVEKYALLIAKALHLTRREREKLRYGCYLHDIGKIGVADTILQEPNLSGDEREQLRKHSEKGAEIIEGMEFLTEVKDIILYHQERYDGKGYPKGLKGAAIPLLARIVAVADALDAMTTDRPYRNKIGFKEALDNIEANAGTQFDPEVCAALLRYRDEIQRIAAKHFK